MRWVARAAMTVLVGLGVTHLGLLAYVFAARAGYPLDLEWMEGGTLTHALRLMNGEPIYAPPSVEFISFLYTPLYPALLALLGKLAGLSYLLGRLVSIVSIALAIGLAFLIVRREGGHPGWAVAAAGLAAASFGPTEGWYDLVRVDSFALFFMTAGLYVLRHHHRSAGGVALAAAILSLGVFAKQTVVLHLAIGGVALLSLNWRLAWVYAVVGGVVVGGGLGVLDVASDGWFRTYVFEIHQRHDFYWDRFLYLTQWRMIRAAPVLVILPLSIWFWAVARSSLGVGTRYWGFVGAASIFASSLGWSTQWSNFNATIPGFFFLSVALGVGASAVRRPWLSTVLALAVAGQLAWLRPNPKHEPWSRKGWSLARHVPDARMRSNAKRFLAKIAGIQGPLLIPYHPFYPTLVGRDAHFHQMGINDLTRAGMRVPSDLREAIRDKTFAAIVLDRPPDPRYAGRLSGYRMERIPGNESPTTLIGFRVRPSLLYLRKPMGAGPPPDDRRPAPSSPRPRESGSTSRSNEPRRSPAQRR